VDRYIRQNCAPTTVSASFSGNPSVEMISMAVVISWPRPPSSRNLGMG
jgi:hypothetical protein